MGKLIALIIILLFLLAFRGTTRRYSSGIVVRDKPKTKRPTCRPYSREFTEQIEKEKRENKDKPKKSKTSGIRYIRESKDKPENRQENK